MDINKLVKNQKNFFKTGKTKDVNFRIESLNKLYDAIKKYEKEIRIKKDSDEIAIKADSVHKKDNYFYAGYDIITTDF